MKNVITINKVVLGKDASMVVKMADFDADYTLMFNTVIQDTFKGVSVGITPRTPVNKKAHIQEVGLLIKELNKTIDKMTTSMSKSTKKEVVAPMKKQFGSRAAWADTKTNEAVGKKTHEGKPLDRAYRNAQVGTFQKHAIEVANQRYHDFGEFPVTVTGIEWYSKPKTSRMYPESAPKLGKLHVTLPRGYATTKWMVKEGGSWKAEWHDFGDYQLNQTISSKRQFNPAPGSGELILEIKQNVRGQLYITLPKSESFVNERGVTIYPDRLRTRDVRFSDNDPHSGNNANLEAGLTAYLRFFYNEFVQANPMNRHGVDEHCGTCKFNMYVPGYDGMDNTSAGYKNTLNTNDTIEMVQWGQEIPRRFCMVHRELTDLDSAKEINEALQKEETTYFDEEGSLRFLRDGEVVLHGRGVHRLVAIKEGTKERCAACPHYHNNSPKSDEQIGKEKAAGAAYVSKYWSEDGRADRVVIQTLEHTGRHTEWVNKYPGEVAGAIEFRVYSIGGVIVSGSEEINDYARETGVLSLIPMMEEVNEVEAKAAKVTNYIHQACNRFSDLKSETLKNILALIAKKPEGISERMNRRWDGAVERLVTTIETARGE